MMFFTNIDTANAIAAPTGGNGKNCCFDASGETVAVLKAIGTTQMDGKSVAIVRLSATQLGLNIMTRMGYFSSQAHPDCAIIVKISVFTNAEFTRWLDEYRLPENSTAILAPSNCVGVIALNKPVSVAIDSTVTTANWRGLTVFGNGIGVMQLAYCEHLGYYVLLNHSMKTYIVIPDFLLSKELPYSDQNFKDFVHSEVLSDYSTEAHQFGVIM
ncbi:hypothetical protein EBS02_12090 [bacterium]|nr:hypothetical protein [bacterium]